MLLTEHEGKRLLRAAGIMTPRGALFKSAAQLAHRRFAYPVAVKAQVAAGGRGKAGGVIKAANARELRSAASRIFKMHFDGALPIAVLVEPWLPIARELYLSVTVDPGADGYAVLYSPRGGIDVEHNAPVSYGFGPARNFRGYRLREALAAAEPDGALRERIVGIAQRLVRLAASRDCSTVEINPLARLEDGTLVAADAKIVRDDYARFRHADIADAIAAQHRREPKAIAKALAGDLMLVWLDGDVGLISGGAGMTMAAMDMIFDAGGTPACFLDCSANPTPAGYRLAFELLDGSPQVRAILVSIFGGLTQMDRAAKVMKDIMHDRKSRKPVVFRLNGTNAGRIDDIFAGSALRNHLAAEPAVKEVVALARKAGRS